MSDSNPTVTPMMQSSKLTNITPEDSKVLYTHVAYRSAIGSLMCLDSRLKGCHTVL